MGVLKNPRHEAFAQALAKGRSLDAAYVEAGYAENNGNACRLNGNEKVRRRVEELQSKKAERVVYDRAKVLSRLEENDQTAREIGNLFASNRSLELIGKELGMFKEQREISGPGGGPIQMVADIPPRPQTYEEWIRERSTQG